MSLYLDTNTLSLSETAQDGLTPFSTSALNELSDSLSTNSAVLSKAPETAEMISNFVINQLKTNTNRQEVKDLFDAYENF